MNQRGHQPSNFYVWLMKQVNEQTLIGNLATEAKRDVFFPRAGSTIEPFKKYLIQKSGDALVIQTLDDAWNEYSDQIVKK